MAVLMSKPQVSMETVNDLHGDLINLARVVQIPDLALQLYDRLARTPMNEGSLLASIELLDSTSVPSNPDVSRAEAYFVQSWMMRSGIAGTDLGKRGAGRCIAVRYTVNGGAPAARWRNVVQSIPAWHERLLNVLILNRDGFDVLSKIDDDHKTGIYCDPPYLTQTRSGLKGSGAQSKYLHEFGGGFMGSGDDHGRLAALLRRFKKARVVVSYYDHPELGELYPGWTVRHCTMKKAMVSQAKRGEGNETVAPEVLLINGPSYAKHGEENGMSRIDGVNDSGGGAT
jgi:DNA adenine methylase